MTQAEAKFAVFQVKHNLAFNIADHYSKITSSMYPDSKVAAQYGSGRTKSTAMITREFEY